VQKRFVLSDVLLKYCCDLAILVITLVLLGAKDRLLGHKNAKDRLHKKIFLPFLLNTCGRGLLCRCLLLKHMLFVV